jgi:hypothetical protein
MDPLPLGSMKKLSLKLKPGTIVETEIVGRMEGPLSRAEETRYKALKEKLVEKMDIISTAFVEMGAILRQVRDERLYRSEFTAFEDFCRQYVGASKRYVNRIIQAEGVIDALLEAGEDKGTLPNSVRLTRELALYPKAEMQKIWQMAKQLALADGKAKPDSNTVREAAAKLESSPQAVERATEALIQKIEGIDRALRVSIGWEFLGPREVARLKKALGHIVAKAAALLKSAPPAGLVVSDEDELTEDEEDDIEESK